MSVIDPEDISRLDREGVPSVRGLVLGGRVVAAAGTRPLRSPVDRQVLGEVPMASPAQVDEAVAAARAALPEWQELGERGRRPILQHIRERLPEAAESLAEHIVLETGKPWVEALYEVFTVLEVLDHAMARAPALLERQRVRLPQLHLRHKDSYLVHEALGVAGVISPWNFPLAIPAGEVVQALVMGNTVVLKPSEWTPFTALAFASLLELLGLPPGVVNVVSGDGEAGQALAAAAVDHLTFVGSVATGRKVEAQGRARGIPVSLEMGGKDPALVCPDAPLPQAAQGLVWGAMMNAGQGCSSVEVAFVHKALHDRFVADAVQAAEAIVVGDGRDPAVWMGPLVMKAQLDKVSRLVDEAVAAGARVETGGRVLGDLGKLFYAPTVLSGVTPEMSLMHEEIFGPVLPIRKVESMEQAVAEANQVPYALGASVWSGDVEAATLLGRRLVTGTLWVNDCLFSHAAPQAPWGGPGMSGGGRTHGDFGLLKFTRPVYVATDHKVAGPKDGWYPYGAERLAFTRAALDLLYTKGLVPKLRALPTIVRGIRS